MNNFTAWEKVAPDWYESVVEATTPAGKVTVSRVHTSRADDMP
jgi:hypothetical protein